MSVKAIWHMQCPSCGSDEKISVEVTVYASLSVDGTEIEGGDHEWTGESGAACKCGRLGLVAQFRDAHYETVARAAGWEHGGDNSGFWYDGNEFESWKAAASADDAATYATAEEICRADGLLDEDEEAPELQKLAMSELGALTGSSEIVARMAAYGVSAMKGADR